jgi:DNA-binding winged helix-turn-helix (wHTH) protein
LLNGETRIRLRPQAATLLLLLLDQRGRPVSRIEIESHLWKGGVPPEVDVGQQINACVSLIRRVLNDRAKAPTYIATVEDGYQFIAPVSFESGDEQSAEVEGSVISDPTVNTAPPEPDFHLKAPHRGQRLIWAGIFGTFIVALFAFAAVKGAYGLAILLCCTASAATIILYGHSKDTVFSRAGLATALLAVMAYVPSAATLSQVVGSVVNGTTLKPAVIYPFVTGLKFVPLFFAVVAEWILLAPDENGSLRRHPKASAACAVLAVVSLVVCATTVVWNLGDDLIWGQAVPGSRLIAVGYFAVSAVNIAVWFVGHHAFGKPDLPSFRILLLGWMIAYLPVGLAGFIIDQEYNSINLHYLKARRPVHYRALNPGAIDYFKHNPKGELSSEIGPDLWSLLNDPAFERVLRTKPFYKQDFDELFQIGTRSVMFGFEVTEDSPGRGSRFTIIRFPETMAVALRFQSVP